MADSNTPAPAPKGRCLGKTPRPDPEERRPMLDSLPDMVALGESLFDGSEAQPHSCYAGLIKQKEGDNPHLAKLLRIIPPGRLWPNKDDQPIARQGEIAHDQMRAFVLNEYYPCLGARAAFVHGTYRFGFYKQLAHIGSVAAMGADLKRFCQEYERLGNFTTFIAVFKRPQLSSEDDFEDLLWQHLQLMHDHDVDDWDPHYSPDPASPNFAFSFQKTAFFVVGMHAGSSRFSRRFAFPVLIFNPESQIRRLKEEGALAQFTKKVRMRDEIFQGTINPSLPTTTDTTGGEPRVYSGKLHKPGDGWVCPFVPRKAVPARHKARPTDKS